MSTSLAVTNSVSTVRPGRASRLDYEVLIIGSGFAGLGMAIQLDKAGFPDFALIEKEDEVGGTWRVNDYPGCACDIPSHMYSFSFEGNPDWSRDFATQPEILAYLRRCAEKYGVRSRIQFGTQMVGLAYDEDACLWSVQLAKASEVRRFMQERGLKPGDALPVDDPDMPTIRTVRARVVVSGMGALSTPAFPKVKGLESFKGHAFHSQQWDHAYDLAGKRVAVIGTGASAIQFVPRILPTVARLDVYQRTPPWILPKADEAIPASLRRLYRSFPLARQLRRLMIYLGLESRAIALAFLPVLVRAAEAYARHHLRKQVPDPVLRAKLTPDYALGCKRVLLTNDWLQALTRPNVDVVTSGISEVREHSIVDGEGIERPVDAIIYGTGFRIQDLVPRGLVTGRGGADLIDGWARGPEAYKGTTFAGFPNLFWLLGPNTGLGHNSVVYMIESQIHYVVEAMRTMRDRDLVELEVEREAQQRFNVGLERRGGHTVWTQGGCRSYYLNPATGRNFAIWPGFTFTFRSITRSFDVANYRQRRRVAASYPLEASEAAVAVP